MWKWPVNNRVKLKNVTLGIVSAEFEGLVQAIVFSIYHEYEGYHKKQLKLVKSDERKGSGSFFSLCSSYPLATSK
jgi:hypothetical protein